MEPTYRCLIVDDEKPAHMVLRAHIDRCPDLTWSHSAYNGEQALAYLRQNEVSIIFLDVDMPVINGIDLLTVMPPRMGVIMTTAYTEFAFTAYQHNVIDYLQKPITYLRFCKAIDKGIAQLQRSREIIDPPTELEFRINGEQVVVSFSNVLYVQAFGNYIKLHFAERKKAMVVYESLVNLANLLGKKQFVQVHRSFLVNRAFIASVGTDSVFLANGECLPVGRKFHILLS